MDFTILRNDLKTALARVQGVVDKRNTIPLLSNILIEALDDSIRITASDMEVASTGEHKAQISASGEVCVNAKQIYDIVKQLPSSTVQIKRLANDWLELKCGGSYFRIVGLSTEGFPGVPNIEKLAGFSIQGAVLSRMIEGVFFSIASDDSRYGLNGAFLEIKPGEKGSILRMVSTDGHRLSLIDQQVDVDIASKGGFLLPRKGLQELKKMCDEAGKEGEEIEVSLASNSGLFHWGSFTFFMRFLEGEFPDYRQVIPKNPQRQVDLEHSVLVNALKRVSILSSERTHSVRFDIGEDTLGLSASNQDVGESREQMPATVTGDKLSIGFNAKYFLEALQVIKSEYVTMDLGEHLHPAIVRPKDTDGAIYVVMPMRLD